MDLIATKVLVAFLFGIVRLVFGLLPVKCYAFLKDWENEAEKRHKKVNCFLIQFQAFSGGVLFATCLLHMMPEVYESVEELKKYTQCDFNYPFSQLIVCFGFFLVYFVEEVSHWLLSKVPDENCSGRNLISSGSNKVIPKIEENGKAFVIEDCVKENKQTMEENRMAFVIKNDDTSSVTKIIGDDDTLSLHSNNTNSSSKENDNSLDSYLEAQEANEKNQEAAEEIEANEDVEKTVEKQSKSKQHVFRYILIILALSLHAIFEGLAIGLQNSVANIWYLFTAVSIHSAIILFCVGLELVLAKAKVKTIVFQILILSTTSPFGVLLGLLITMRANMNTKAKSAAVVVLEGLSAGTILYITFFEVLNREKHRRVYRMRRALCILTGFALMAVLEYAEIYH